MLNPHNTDETPRPRLLPHLDKVHVVIERDDRTDDRIKAICRAAKMVGAKVSRAPSRSLRVGHVRDGVIRSGRFVVLPLVLGPVRLTDVRNVLVPALQHANAWITRAEFAIDVLDMDAEQAKARLLPHLRLPFHSHHTSIRIVKNTIYFRDQSSIRNLALYADQPSKRHRKGPPVLHAELRLNKIALKHINARSIEEFAKHCYTAKIMAIIGKYVLLGNAQLTADRLVAYLAKPRGGLSTRDTPTRSGRAADLSGMSMSERFKVWGSLGGRTAARSLGHSGRVDRARKGGLAAKALRERRSA